jgi:hypothetical protein
MGVLGPVPRVVRVRNCGGYSVGVRGECARSECRQLRRVLVKTKKKNNGMKMEMGERRSGTAMVQEGRKAAATSELLCRPWQTPCSGPNWLGAWATSLCSLCDPLSSLMRPATRGRRLRQFPHAQPLKTPKHLILCFSVLLWLFGRVN